MKVCNIQIFTIDSQLLGVQERFQIKYDGYISTLSPEMGIHIPNTNDYNVHPDYFMARIIRSLIIILAMK